MKLLIKKEILLENLNKVSKALSTKNLIPALAGIKFDLDEKGLTLTASDNDITIQAFIENKNENMEYQEPGSIIIQGKYILDIVRKIPDEKFSVEVYDETKVIINTQKCEYNLNGIDKREYPTINLESNKNPIIMDSKKFKNMINQTSFATSTDESRPQLTGLNFNINVDNFECNATNSFRLARKEIKLDNMVEGSYNIIVPSKNINEIAKILEDEDLEISIFNNKIIFKSCNLIIQSRLINSTYPNTSNLVPKTSNVTIKLNKEEFYNVIDRVSILTSDKEKNIVTLTTNEQSLTMKSMSEGIGRIEETMLMEEKISENIDIAFSARYMMDALKVLQGEYVTLSFLTDISPILIKDDKEEDLIQLILPIRTY